MTSTIISSQRLSEDMPPPPCGGCPFGRPLLGRNWFCCRWGELLFCSRYMLEGSFSIEMPLAFRLIPTTHTQQLQTSETLSLQRMYVGHHVNTVLYYTLRKQVLHGYVGCALNCNTKRREAPGAILSRSAGRLSASSLPTVGSKHTKS